MFKVGDKAVTRFTRLGWTESNGTAGHIPSGTIVTLKSVDEVEGWIVYRDQFGYEAEGTTLDLESIPDMDGMNVTQVKLDEVATALELAGHPIDAVLILALGERIRMLSDNDFVVTEDDWEQGQGRRNGNRYTNPLTMALFEADES